MVEIEWNKYIKWGKFTSTSGLELNFKWEFDRIEKDPYDRLTVMCQVFALAFGRDLIGIHTVHPKDVEKSCEGIYFPSGGCLDLRKFGKSRQHLKDYVIYDDVITTGKTIKKCIDYIGNPPSLIVCIIDRRKETKTDYLRDYKVYSIEDILNARTYR